MYHVERKPQENQTLTLNEIAHATKILGSSILPATFRRLLLETNVTINDLIRSEQWNTFERYRKEVLEMMCMLLRRKENMPENKEVEQELQSFVNRVKNRLHIIEHLELSLQENTAFKIGDRVLNLRQCKSLIELPTWLKQLSLVDNAIGSIILPPGMGKTTLALAIAEHAEVDRVIYIGDNNTNGEQVLEEYDKIAGETKDPLQRSIGRLYAGYKDLHKHTIVASPKSLEKHLHNLKNQLRLDDGSVHILFVDEADITSMGKKSTELLKRLREEFNVVTIFLSGTTQLGNGKNLLDSSDLIYGVHTPSDLPELRANNEIPPMHFEDHYVDVSVEVRSQKDKYVPSALQVTNRLVMCEAFHSYIIKHYKEHHFGQPGIVGFQTNKEAEEFARRANAAGVTCLCLTQEIKSLEERKKIKQQLNSGEIHMIAGSKMVGRGLNIPRLTAAYNATLTRSPQEFWQFVLRISRHAEDKECGYAYNILPREFTIKDGRKKNPDRKRKLSTLQGALRFSMFFEIHEKRQYNAVKEDSLKGKKKGTHVEYDLDYMQVVRSSEQVFEMQQSKEDVFDACNRKHLQLILVSPEHFIATLWEANEPKDMLFTIPEMLWEVDGQKLLNGFAHSSLWTDWKIRLQRLAFDVWGRDALPALGSKKVKFPELKHPLPMMPLSCSLEMAEDQYGFVKELKELLYPFDFLHLGLPIDLKEQVVFSENMEHYVECDELAQCLFHKDSLSATHSKALLQYLFPDFAERYIFDPNQHLHQHFSLDDIKHIYRTKKWSKQILQPHSGWLLSLQDIFKQIGKDITQAKNSDYEEFILSKWPELQKHTIDYDNLEDVYLLIGNDPSIFFENGQIKEVHNITFENPLNGWKIQAHDLYRHLTGKDPSLFEHQSEREEAVKHLINLRWLGEAEIIVLRYTLNFGCKTSLSAIIGDISNLVDKNGRPRKMEELEFTGNISFHEKQGVQNSTFSYSGRELFEQFYRQNKDTFSFRKSEESTPMHKLHESHTLALMRFIAPEKEKLYRNIFEPEVYDKRIKLLHSVNSEEIQKKTLKELKFQYGAWKYTGEEIFDELFKNEHPEVLACLTEDGKKELLISRYM